MGSKPKGPSAKQLKAEELQLQLLQKQLATSQQPLEMPSFAIPPPAPPPPPPPSASSADALEASTDQRRKAAARTNAGRNTIFAGETGGLGGMKQYTGQPSTLLG